MEKLERDLEKFQKARKDSAAEQEAMIRAVDEYLQGEVREGRSHKDVLKIYFDKYKDFLDNETLVEPLKTADQMKLLKRVIYQHEIRPTEKKKGEGIREAA